MLEYMSPNTLEHLRRRFRVDPRDVRYRECSGGRIVAYCPKCRAADLWRGTRAVGSKAEALQLLQEHLTVRHGASLYRPSAGTARHRARAQRLGGPGLDKHQGCPSSPTTEDLAVMSCKSLIKLTVLALLSRS